LGSSGTLFFGSGTGSGTGPVVYGGNSFPEKKPDPAGLNALVVESGLWLAAMRGVCWIGLRCLVYK